MWIPQEDENKGRQEDRQPSPQLWTQEADRLGHPLNSARSVQLPFPKSARVLNRSHFRNILKGGNRLIGSWIAVDYRLGRSSRPRLGITVSKRHGKAHDRTGLNGLCARHFVNFIPNFPHP